MASNIKFKRSAVQNRVPTTAQLELGELALNTYDGKLYTEINTGSAAVVEIGSKLSSLVVDGDNGAGNGDVVFHGATAGRDLTWDASDNALKFADNAIAYYGSGNDLNMYHTGGQGYIKNTTGTLYIQDDTNIIIGSVTGSETGAKYIKDGAFELYHNNNLRLATTDDGADISGTGSLKLPVGTTAQRSGSPTAGDMRYNTTTGSFEGYSTNWGELGGGGVGIGSTTVNPGSGVVSNRIGVGFTDINFVGAGLSVTGYGTTIVVDIGNAVSRKYGRSIHSYTATANQTTFTGMSYTDGAAQISVYLNGAKLSAATYTATSGNTVVLGTGASVDDEVEIICIDSGVDITRTVHSFTATAGQTAFTGLGYERGENLDVYLNGIRLAQSDYTATNGTSITLAAGASVGDLLEVVDMGPGAQWESGFGEDNDDIFRFNGGVGIGTTNPTDKLNIVGNAEIVGIVTATSFTGTLNTAAQTNITSLGTLTALGVAGDVTITDTDTGSAAGPEFKLYRNSASPADADYLGQIKFAGESDTGVERNYAKITGKILDASNGTEDGIIEFAHIKAGSQTITGRFRSDSLQLLNGTSLTVAGSAEVTGSGSFSGDLDIAADIRHIGDTNTKISFSGADTIQLTTGGTARVTVTDATTTVANNLTVTGNLQVDGTNTVVNSTTMTVDDKNIVLGSGAANDAAADGGGITLESGNGNKTFNWVDSTDAWTSSEHIHLGDNKKLLLGASSDLQIYHDPTHGHSFIKESGSGGLILGASVFEVYNAAISEKMITATADGAVELYHNGTKKINTHTDGIEVLGKLYMADNKNIELGSSQDFKIYHDSGGNSYIKETGGGALVINADDFYLQNNATTTYLRTHSGGAIDLNHSGNKKFETISSGVSVTGDIAVSTANRIYFGNSDVAFIKGEHGGSGYLALGANTEHMRIVRSGDIGLGGITAPLWTTGGGMHLDDNYGIGFGDGGSGRPDFQIVTTAGATLDFRCGFGGDTADIQMTTGGELKIVGTDHAIKWYRDAGDRYGSIYYDGGNFNIKSPSNDHTRVLNSSGTELISFNHDTTIDIPGGVLQLGTANTSSAHLNAYENMTFNIDTDNDDTNRTFTWKTDSSTELMKLEESGLLHTVQDYPNFRAMVDWNFITVKKLDPRITYQRTGPASYVDEYGKVVLVGDNVPRFDHDPLTGECKGLLIEHSRTNLIPNSFDKGTWSAGSGGNTVTRNAGIAPDGTETATKVLSANNDIDVNTQLGNASAGATGQISISGGTTYTLSIWAKASTTAQVGNNFKLRWKRVQGDSVSASTTFALTADWTRYTATATTAANNSTIACYVGGVSGSEALLWGAQFEAGSYSTSLIPTYGAAATRGSDFAYLDGTVGTEFDDIYRTDEGTFIIDWFNDPNGNHNDGYVFAVDDGTGNNRIAAVNSNSYQVTVTSGGSSQGTRDLGSINSGDNKIAFTYKLNDQATSLNGSDVSVDTTCTIPTTTLKYWWFGCRQGQYDLLGGYMKRIIYYSKRLPNSQLKNLSS